MLTKRPGYMKDKPHVQLPEALRGRLASSVDYCVLDCEMTGLDVMQHEIISIGAVRISKGRIDLGQSFYRVLRPRRATMSRENVLIHHLTHDQVAAGEEPELVMDDFTAFIQDTILVGHFVSIDLGFLNALFTRHHRSRPELPALDTRYLQEWYLDNCLGGLPQVGLQLSAICDHHGVPRFQEHHAYYDALTTACLFLKQLALLEASDRYTLEDIYTIGRECLA